MAPARSLNLHGLSCPLPVLKTKKALAEMASGELLEVLASDPGAWDDFDYFCKNTGHTLVERSQEENGNSRFLIRVGG